jgi:NhaP-type Na+/H+ or K+/H+ antiporter
VNSAAIEIAKQTLLSGGIILAIGTLTGFLSQKIKVPDVAVFLIAGMLIGPSALGFIDIKADSALNQIILLFGASYILFDGGASLRLAVLKRVWITIVVISTIGVLITAATSGAAAHFILHLPWIVALLLLGFMCWTRETSVIPAGLAGLLLGMKAPGADVIASVTFIAILMAILIKAPTTRWLGQRLDLMQVTPRSRRRVHK